MKCLGHSEIYKNTQHCSFYPALEIMYTESPRCITSPSWSIPLCVPKGHRCPNPACHHSPVSQQVQPRSLEARAGSHLDLLPLTRCTWSLHPPRRRWGGGAGSALCLPQHRQLGRGISRWCSCVCCIPGSMWMGFLKKILLC